DSLFESVLLHKSEMLRKTLMTTQPVLRAANRPEQHHADEHFRMHDAELRHRAAAHAAAHHMRPFDVQMFEKAFALRNEIRPGDALDAPPRLAAFAPVEEYAGVFSRQMFQQFDLHVDALRRPFVEARIEPGWRIHQQRRTGADDFVTRVNSVDNGVGHGLYL